MNEIEERKKLLKELTESSQSIHKAGMDIDTMLEVLCEQSFAIARIVHSGQRDKAGRLYIFHPLRVALKSSTLLGYCAALLHDAVEDGKEVGVTLDFLRDEMLFPPILVTMVEVLTRLEGESYGDYLRRVAHNYLASKVKLDDNIDNSDITRYDNPTRQQQITCAGYLEKAWTLKSNAFFQREMKFDYVNELIAIASISPMLMVGEVTYEDGNVTYARFYFGYEGHQDRRYTIIYNAAKDLGTGRIVAQLTTIPARKDYDKNGLYKPRRMELEFSNSQDADDYLKQMTGRLLDCFNIKQVMTSEHFLERSSLNIAIDEKEMLDRLSFPRR